jgi:hypothetical protein
MPTGLTLHDPSRMILGVATGKLTVGAFAEFLREFRAVGKSGYRKIVDFSTADLDFDEKGLLPGRSRRAHAEERARSARAGGTFGVREDKILKPRRGVRRRGLAARSGVAS